MNKKILIILAALLVFAVGCKKKSAVKKNTTIKTVEIKTVEIKTNIPIEKIELPTGPPTNKVYLADLRKVYFQNVYGKPRWGVDFSGKVIRFKGQTYRKGITTHPPEEKNTINICPLEKKYRIFQSYIFVNSEKGSVTFRIEADGKEIFNSGEMTGENNPLLIDVDVTGVNKLKMIVNKGKDNFSDHAVWGDPALLY